MSPPEAPENETVGTYPTEPEPVKRDAKARRSDPQEVLEEALDIQPPDEEKTTKPSGEEKEQEEKTPAIDAGLKARAETAGMSADDIANFGSSEELERALNLADRMAARKLIDERDERPEEPAKDRRQKVQDSVAPLEDLSFEKVEFEEEEFDEKLGLMLANQGTLQKDYVARMGRIENVLAQVIESIRFSRAADAESRFDRLVDEHADEYGDVLGTGPGSDLEPKSAHLKNRIELMKDIEVLRELYASRDKKVPSDRTLFRRAAAARFEKQRKSAADKRKGKDVEKRRSQFTAPPTSRRRSGPEADGDPKDRAVNRVRELLDKMA